MHEGRAGAEGEVERAGLHGTGRAAADRPPPGIGRRRPGRIDDAPQPRVHTVRADHEVGFAEVHTQILLRDHILGGRVLGGCVLGEQTTERRHAVRDPEHRKAREATTAWRRRLAWGGMAAAACLVAAVVVARSDAPPGSPTLPEIRRFLSTRLADYQVPSVLELLDRLPRNEGGKVLKRQLTRQLTDRADESRRDRP